jgi:hypothetical protein
MTQGRRAGQVQQRLACASSLSALGFVLRVWETDQGRAPSSRTSKVSRADDVRVLVDLFVIEYRDIEVVDVSERLIIVQDGVPMALSLVMNTTLQPRGSLRLHRNEVLPTYLDCRVTQAVFSDAPCGLSGQFASVRVVTSL